MLMLSSISLIAQNQNIGKDTMSTFPDFTALETKMVHSCNLNSRVTMISASMEVSQKKLPKAIKYREIKQYYLNSKSRKVVFSFKHERDNRIVLWLDGKEKHCFSLDSLYNFSFTTYRLTTETLEVYGKIRWEKFYRNFRVIFYPKRNEVLFDLDDGIFQVSH